MMGALKCIAEETFTNLNIVWCKILTGNFYVFELDSWSLISPLNFLCVTVFTGTWWKTLTFHYFLLNIWTASVQNSPSKFCTIQYIYIYIYIYTCTRKLTNYLFLYIKSTLKSNNPSTRPFKVNPSLRTYVANSIS